MASLPPARLRLFALCVALGCQTAAITAINFQTLKLLQNGSYAAYRPGTLAAWLGLCSLPALILAPFIGVLAGSRWNRRVLLATSAIQVSVAGLVYLYPDLPWLSIAGLLSVEAAFFVPAAITLILSIGRTGMIRIPNIALGIAIALVVGAGLGGFVAASLRPRDLPSATTCFTLVQFVAVTYVAGDPRNRLAESISLSQGILHPFLDGVRGAIRQRRARHALVGLWLWFFVTLTVVVAWIRIGFPNEVRYATWSFILAAALGILVSALNRNPYRHAGFALYGALVAAGSILCMRFWDAGQGPLIGLGFALGLSISPLLSFYFTWTTPKHHGVAAALILGGWCAGALILAALLGNLGDDAVAARTPLLNILLGVTAFAFLAGIASFFRPAMEMAAETLVWPIYRVRAVGPGVDRLPDRGPYLVIGNHAAWFDPLFFAKMLPTPIVPMMTSKFYDLPAISWLMRHVIGTIRVPEKAVRHDAPELKEAVAALNRGECLVLFPEGYLRRKEEVPLRRFGRGVWQILRDRPQTPVFACWIEGNWGSYMSYHGGPPTKGKRFDFWLPIRIGVIGPIIVDAATLADHMATRTFLMQQVSEARRPLGLEPLALPGVHDAEGDKE